MWTIHTWIETINNNNKLTNLVSSFYPVDQFMGVTALQDMRTYKKVGSSVLQV